MDNVQTHNTCSSQYCVHWRFFIHGFNVRAQQTQSYHSREEGGCGHGIFEDVSSSVCSKKLRRFRKIRQNNGLINGFCCY
jgi:hypothetical protein